MSLSEHELITQTIMKYVNAVVVGTHQDAVDAWHIKGKRITYDENEEKVIFQPSPANSMFSSYKPNPEVKQDAKIVLIEITRSIASVKLRWNVRFGSLQKICTDYLLLLKSKEGWKIVGKVSDIENVDT